MVDYEGNMIEKKDRIQILLSDVPDDEAMTQDNQISNTEG